MTKHEENVMKHPEVSGRQQVGWGADLDPANRPSWPKELPSDVTTLRGNFGVRQIPTVKIHQSIEHPDLTPVFGTTCPPRGLSGALRDYSYARFSEGRLAHWLTLLLADRIDVVEGLFEDLSGKAGGRSAEKPLAGDPRRSSITGRNAAIAGAALAAVVVGVVVAQRMRERR